LFFFKPSNAEIMQLYRYATNCLLLISWRWPSLVETCYFNNNNNNPLVVITIFNTLNAELNPICNLLALLGAHQILHVSRIRVNGQNSYLLTSDKYLILWQYSLLGSPNPLNGELNPICHLLALLAHHIFHVSGLRVKLPQLVHTTTGYFNIQNISVCFVTTDFCFRFSDKENIFFFFQVRDPHCVLYDQYVWYKIIKFYIYLWAR